jgi:hypothetical protein
VPEIPAAPVMAAAMMKATTPIEVTVLVGFTLWAPSCGTLPGAG